MMLRRAGAFRKSNKMSPNALLMWFSSLRSSLSSIFIIMTLKLRGASESFTLLLEKQELPKVILNIGFLSMLIFMALPNDAT